MAGFESDLAIYKELGDRINRVKADLTEAKTKHSQAQQREDESPTEAGKTRITILQGQIEALYAECRKLQRSQRSILPHIHEQIEQARGEAMDLSHDSAMKRRQ